MRLLGIAKANVSQGQRYLGRRRRRIFTEAHLGRMLGNLRDPHRRGNHLSQMLKRPRHRRQRLKSSQRTEDKERNQRPRLSITPDATRREPQHGKDGDGVDQQHHRL